MSLFKILLFKIVKTEQKLTRFYAKLAKAPILKTNFWEPVIGLEIHAQIAAKSKLFSGAEAKFAAPTNSLVSFFDASLPGTLPVLNRRCVEAGVQTAFALNCKLNMVSTFDRKHYFYADLPAGYQITQQRQPIATGGHVNYLVYDTEDGKKIVLKKMVRLIQVQLEQDSGKSLHDIGQSQSLIDLNRAGVGLMEIITEPDFRSSKEAGEFVRELRLILLTIGTCNSKMEEGSLRVDASVSVRRPGDPLGVRSEVKNLNSVRSMVKAIDYEIKRQISLIESGGEVVNETMTFDIESEKTVPMRDKERLHDYRFMAEPNLPPLRLYNTQTLPSCAAPGSLINVDEVIKSIPELPDARRERLLHQFGFSYDQIKHLMFDLDLLDCLEQCLSQGQRDPSLTCSLCVYEIRGALNRAKQTFGQSCLTAEHMGDLVDMLQSHQINQFTATDVIELLLKNTGKSVRQLVEENKWYQVKDEVVLENACMAVLERHPNLVAEYKNGKSKLFNYFIGQALKEVHKRAEAEDIVRVLQRILSD